METPEELLSKLQIEENVNAVVEVHKAAQEAINHFEMVKTKAKMFVQAYLMQTAKTRGRTAGGTFGITKPTTTYRVNEKKWRAACRQNANLAAIQQQFDQAQQALDEAQRAYLEEATPTPVVYIR